MATKTRLGRQIVYAPFDEDTLNFPLDETDLHNLAFMADPTAEPVGDNHEANPTDWHEAMVITSTSGENGQPHPLYDKIGSPALAMYVGPLRGDDMGDAPHIDLDVSPHSEGHLVWSDLRHPASKERLTDWHGPLKVVTV